MDDPRTDEMLMLAYRDGDAEAFEALYSRHRARLYPYLVHQCGQRALADELFQEVWMSVIKARSRYEVTAKFTTWLFRIAHNRVIDAFRSRGRQAEFEVDRAEDDGDGDGNGGRPDCPAPPADQPERRAERRELAVHLVAAVEALPAAQREAFLMAAEGGLTLEEIGNATGTGYETVKSRLRYAYARLRKELEAWR